MSETATKPRQIRWYRTPIEREHLKALSQRSNFRGFVQTFSYLGLYAATVALPIYGLHRWPIAAVVALVWIHGVVSCFMINGVHELGHGAVFRTKWLNRFFDGLLAFLGWINHLLFEASHGRHHAYTLHPPEDLEVVLPQKFLVRDLFKGGLINFKGFWWVIKDTIRVARGKFKGDWEMTLLPESEMEKRRPIIWWARLLLIGHGLIVAVSIYMHWWLVPVLITFGPFYGGILQSLCNNTQHIALSDNVPDFRLCCRTIYLNPVLEVLYWQMNYHTEHHMYPTVPCYNLRRLHRAVKHDLPACPRGLAAAWREIFVILRRQKENPTYQFVPEVPRAGMGEE
jgi:fatty acid desaturase